MIRGQCRVTTIDPLGRSEIVDFGPGDVWYFPRGHGHSIQSIGREDCLFVLCAGPNRGRAKVLQKQDTG